MDKCSNLAGYEQMTIRGGALKMARKQQNRYLEYERRKTVLLETCTTVEQYQAEIIKLCKELKI
jgi:hypothetical protein